MAYGPNNNAVLVNDCKSLENLKVTVQVTVGLITAGNNGFSLQLNCYPQANSTHRACRCVGLSTSSPYMETRLSGGSSTCPRPTGSDLALKVITPHSPRPRRIRCHKAR